MSNVRATHEIADWVEELQRKIFEECADQSASGLASKDCNVPVSVIVSNVERSFAKIPHFFKRNDFLEELRKSLQKVEHDKCVNWSEFKDSSGRWFHDLLNLVHQDSNNNIRKNHSYVGSEDKEKDAISIEDHNSCSDAIDDDLNSCSMNQMDTIASCYSLSSSSMGFGTSDSIMESSEETDHANDQIAGIDLELRIRRYNDENASLKEELTRAEESILTLERDLKSTQKNLEKLNNKYTNLKKENEELRDVLAEVERREESCKQELRKFEKKYSALKKQVEELDKEKEDVLNLKVKIDKLTNENSDFVKQIAEFKINFDRKVNEYDYLQDEYNELQNEKCQVEKSSLKDIQILQEKVKELESLNADLHSQMMNQSDKSSRLSLTPPPYHYLNAHVHSTPYGNRHKIRHQDSLFNELKASGYDVNDAKCQELREELSFYKQEIPNLIEQVDEALQDIAVSRNQICAPKVQLLDTHDIESLKQRLANLLNYVKTCPAMKESPPVPIMGEDPREKPDVLPDTKKKTGSCLDNDRPFASEKRENDSIGQSMTSLSMSGLCSKIDRSTSPMPEPEVDTKLSSEREQEIIVPIVEALSRIIEIKGSDNDGKIDTTKPVPRSRKQKSIFTGRNNSDWFNVVTEASKAKALATNKITEECWSPSPNINAMGDGPHRDYLIAKNEKSTTKAFIDTTTTDMKTLKSEQNSENSNLDESLRQLDTRYVTLRQNQGRYILNSTVSSSEPSSSFEHSKFDDMKPGTSFSFTPKRSPKIVPCRKLSVYTRSFDIDSLQTPDSIQGLNNGKRRSISTPDVQETDYAAYRSKPIQPLETPITKDQLMCTYRCANNSDSSASPSPKKDESSVRDSDNEFSITGEKENLSMRMSKPIILAPTKFKLPDSTIDQSLVVPKQTKQVKQFIPTMQKKSSFGRISEVDVAQQSRILSGSSDLMKREEKEETNDISSAASDTCNVGSTISTIPLLESSTASTVDIFSGDSHDCTNISDNVFVPNVQTNGQTYTKKGVGAEEPAVVAQIRPRASASSPSSASSKAAATTMTVAAAAASVAATALEETGGSGDASNSGGVIVIDELSIGRAAPVERAMSSGEDSSAESECDAQRQQQQRPNVALNRKKLLASPPKPLAELDNVEKPTQPLVPRKRSNSCTENTSHRHDDNDVVLIRKEKLQTHSTMNDDDKENSCEKVTSDSPPQEVIKEDESPKAFPSWTDEKLQESGIASFPDVDSEISETLSEDELKKKYTSFSVGLSTDRMTLSKRIILSRRHRDQAEKNFTNEIHKMQQGIKELAPLCVDSESVERVERVKLQVEMVARCAHRISCTAETLGAVHQERRVSRAVLLADKYLQTLRAKCEKLAAELTETKRILAENNIVLEENLSELGDDVPRVRYRAVPNNNRTMMARRRASIATISRPLMGSNQDISKEPPRQRNSVSGKVPGLRRPSLCYEAPKWEVEKLDRTDSSSSITELRDIFEQAESRRHSREENNNLIRTSIHNLSTITSEHTEEEDIWSNSREELVPELDNDNEINSLELGQRHNHTLICWLLDRYTAWKTMIWGIFIAFLLGFFMNRAVSSSRRDGPPLSWWSIEEILNQYIQIENDRYSAPRPI